MIASRHSCGAGAELGMLMSDGPGGTKWMCVGQRHAGRLFRDALGHCAARVTVNADGWGEFRCEGGSVSVWVPSA